MNAPEPVTQLQDSRVAEELAEMTMERENVKGTLRDLVREVDSMEKN